MLDKVAFNRKEYVVNNILEDEENLDEADGFRTKIKEIIDQIIEEFKKSLELDKEKGNFVKGLIKMFTILLNTKCSSITKLKKIIRAIACNSFMARTKAIVRRTNNDPVFVPAPGHRTGNKNIMNSRNPTFKIKKRLPETE